jgi:hypothetical protein
MRVRAISDATSGNASAGRAQRRRKDGPEQRRGEARAFGKRGQLAQARGIEVIRRRRRSPAARIKSSPIDADGEVHGA